MPISATYEGRSCDKFRISEDKQAKYRAILGKKVVKKGKNTEGGNKQAETDFNKFEMV